MTVVDPDADDAALRARFGADADEIIAFARFLREMPGDYNRDADPVVLRADMYAYAKGEITGAELVRRMDAAP